jgi:hypothetical protein
VTVATLAIAIAILKADLAALLLRVGLTLIAQDLAS